MPSGLDQRPIEAACDLAAAHTAIFGVSLSHVRPSSSSSARMVSHHPLIGRSDPEIPSDAMRCTEEARL